MTAYFGLLFGGVIGVLLAAWWLSEFGIDLIVAVVKRRRPSNVVNLDEHRRFLAAVSMGRERS